MKNPVEIRKDGKLFAVVVRADFPGRASRFFTPAEYSQQLGLLVHPKGGAVARHTHKPGRGPSVPTQEVLVVLRGKMRAELFDDAGAKIRIVVLKAGDTVLLIRGSHRMTFPAETRILAVKPGPFAGPDEKRFLKDDFRPV